MAGQGIDALSEGVLGGIQIFGRNADIDTGTTPEDVCGTGGVYQGFPTSLAAVPLTAESTAATDALASTGAQRLRVYGMRTATSKSYEILEVDLNGTTQVALGSWYRLHLCEVIQFGSDGQNNGVITVEDGSGNVYCLINVLIGEGLGTSGCCVWTVPAGMAVDIRRVRIACGTASSINTSAQVGIAIRPFGTGGFVLERVFTVNSQAEIDTEFPIPLRLEPLTDVKMTVIDVSDNDTAVDATLHMGP